MEFSFECMRAWGKTVYRLRLKKNWTQQDVAARSGMTQSMISRVENYDCALDGVRLLRIAQAFNLSLVDFVEEAGKDIEPYADAILTDALASLFGELSLESKRLALDLMDLLHSRDQKQRM